MRHLFVILAVFCLVLTHCGPGNEDEASKPGDKEASKPGDKEASKPGDKEASKPGDKEASKEVMTEKAVPGPSGVYTGVLNTQSVKVYISSTLESAEGNLEHVLVGVDHKEQKLCTLLRFVDPIDEKKWNRVSGVKSHNGYIGTYQYVSISFLKPDNWELHLMPGRDEVKNLTKTGESAPSLDGLKKDCGFGHF